MASDAEMDALRDALRDELAGLMGWTPVEDVELGPAYRKGVLVIPRSSMLADLDFVAGAMPEGWLVVIEQETYLGTNAWRALARRYAPKVFQTEWGDTELEARLRLAISARRAGK